MCSLTKEESYKLVDVLINQLQKECKKDGSLEEFKNFNAKELADIICSTLDQKFDLSDEEIFNYHMKKLNSISKQTMKFMDSEYPELTKQFNEIIEQKICITEKDIELCKKFVDIALKYMNSIK